MSGRSPLESTQFWYDLPAVAEAAPLDFLKAFWPTCVQICEQYHGGYESTVLWKYSGFLYHLDENNHRPSAPVLLAVCNSIDLVAASAPEEFISLTKPSWSSANAVVHRLVIRGLCAVCEHLPDVVLEYINGDRRRLYVGSYESQEQSDSLRLVSCLHRHLSESGRKSLESTILSYSQYRAGIELCEDQLVWNREARLRLLVALDPQLSSAEVREVITQEKAVLSDWNRSRGGRMRSGFVNEVPPISKEEMIVETNAGVLEAIISSRNGKPGTWIDKDGFIQRGGIATVGREIAALAADHMDRALDLTRFIISQGPEDLVAEVLGAIRDVGIPDDAMFSLLRTIGKQAFTSEQLRSTVGRVAYGRTHDAVGLPEDICQILKHYLALPWDATHSIGAADEDDGEDASKDYQSSILWGDRGWILDVDLSFWPLLALTHGYLMRTPADCVEWVNILDEHLDRNISIRTWAAYCSEMRWLRITTCDKARNREIIDKLFEKYPVLAFRPEGIRLLAHTSDLIAETRLQEYLAKLRSSGRWRARQGYAEVLTLVAFRDIAHKWAADELNVVCESVSSSANEAVAVGLAHAAAHLWDEPSLRLRATRVLCKVMPMPSDKVSEAVATVLWSRDNFVADEATELLLKGYAENPHALAKVRIVDLAEHLVAIVPHMRDVVLSVCKAILNVKSREDDLFEAGPHLVKIALTLQRFTDTRIDGLFLLEELLRLGLDDAFRVLAEIDIRPTSLRRREPRKRRRRN